MKRSSVLAIDFDGVIYDNSTCDLVPGAADGLHALSDAGWILVLWTCRAGNRLANARNILRRSGLLELFECINATPECVPFKTSQKVCAGVYIDDRNLGGFPGWDRTLEILLGGGA